MSKERELLRRAKCLLECSNMEPLQGQADIIIGEIEELIAQPEQESLTDEELEVRYSQHTWAMEKQEYMWGFRDAEKAYGIGVEE